MSGKQRRVWLLFWANPLGRGSFEWSRSWLAFSQLLARSIGRHISAEFRGVRGLLLGDPCTSSQATHNEPILCMKHLFDCFWGSTSDGAKSPGDFGKTGLVFLPVSKSPKNGR